MSSVFTKIRMKEIPGVIFDDNGEFFLIHTNNPAQLGHLLVIPYQEVDYIFDLNEDTYNNLWEYVKHVSLKLQKILGVKKIGIKVEGLEVNHVHVHLIPINNPGDMENHNPNVTDTEIINLKNSFQL
jgi:histidine triad (HIT) family protein